MEIILALPILFGFCLTFFSIPLWMTRAKRVGLFGGDMHKTDKKKVVEAGGICVMMGFIFGVLIYIAIKTFYFSANPDDKIVEILGLVSVILITSFIGFTDDILGWKIGLNRKVRILLLLFAALPLIVINAGESSRMGMSLGLFYPLVLIPLGIIGASTTFNFLAGYNGLEASQGIIILFGLSVVNFFIGKTWLSMIGLVMMACLAAFYIFNKNPAQIFPGDTMTYSVGALIAGIAILGGTEKIAIFFFIPYILETGLKLRGKLKKESFAKLNEEGGLEMPYKKIYGLEHLAIYILKKIRPKKNVCERDVVYLINFFQILIIIVGFILFRSMLFQ